MLQCWRSSTGPFRLVGCLVCWFCCEGTDPHVAWFIDSRKREAVHDTFQALKEAVWWTRWRHPCYPCHRLEGQDFAARDSEGFGWLGKILVTGLLNSSRISLMELKRGSRAFCWNIASGRNFRPERWKATTFWILSPSCCNTCSFHASPCSSYWALSSSINPKMDTCRCVTGKAKMMFPSGFQP